MTIAKKFLFGGLAMTGIASAGSSIGIHLKNDDTGINIEEISYEELIEKVGLDCGETIEDGNECKKKVEGRRTNFKVNEKKEQDVTFSGEGKLKVYKSRADDYKKKLRFTVEDGDIQLVKVKGTEGVSISPLKKWEGYEIEIDRRENRWYLVRRDTVDQGKIRALGLPSSCALLKGESKNCTLNSQQVKGIEFDGRTDGVVIPTDKRVEITVSKTNDKEIFGDEVYRFTLKPEVDLTISNSNVVKTNIPTDFKIKKNGNKLSLERAWTDNKKLIEKVGLECKMVESKEICTLKSGRKINVKQGSINKRNEIVGFNGNGKIKLLKEQVGYREGFKFVIEGGDITFTGGAKDQKTNDVQKIWEEDSYQIVEEEGKYYFSREDSGLSKKWNKLGLPVKCSYYSSRQWCPINLNELKKIKFYDKKEGANPVVSNSQATIYFKTGQANKGFPLGMKITIHVPGGEIKIPLNDSKHMFLWKGAEVEFKIRDLNSTNPTIEKSYDIKSFAKKLGLNGECNDEDGCTIGGKINVESGGNYQQNASVKSEFRNKKIKYEIGLSDSPSSFTFTLMEDIELSNKPSGFKSDRLKAGNYMIKQKNYRSTNIPYLSWKSAHR